MIRAWTYKFWPLHIWSQTLCPATLWLYPQWRRQYQPVLTASLVIWMKDLIRFKVEKKNISFTWSNCHRECEETVRELYSDLQWFSSRHYPASQRVWGHQRGISWPAGSASTPYILLHQLSAMCIQCHSLCFFLISKESERFCGCESLCFKVMRAVSVRAGKLCSEALFDISLVSLPLYCYR